MSLFVLQIRTETLSRAPDRRGSPPYGIKATERAIWNTQRPILSRLAIGAPAPDKTLSMVNSSRTNHFALCDSRDAVEG
jgi:hypothetical protein